MCDRTEQLARVKLMEMEESASVNPWAPMKVTTVRFGSKVDLRSMALRTSAFGGKADVQIPLEKHYFVHAVWVF